tara:strand:- start:926 stop:1114 length:189 start_codon:yes stop_codon:yes gene_type:complete
MNWKEELKCPCCDYHIGLMMSYDENNEYEEWSCNRPDQEDGIMTCGWSESIWIRDITHLLEE